mgnify:CR=1 FL=1
MELNTLRGLIEFTDIVHLTNEVSYFFSWIVYNYILEKNEKMDDEGYFQLLYIFSSYKELGVNCFFCNC